MQQHNRFVRTKDSESLQKIMRHSTTVSKLQMFKQHVAISNELDCAVQVDTRVCVHV